MMLLLVKLRLRKSVRMRLLDIQPTPSAPSGQRRSAVLPKRMSRSTPQSLDVPRNQESSVPQLVVDSSKELRSVMTKPRLLFRMPPRKSVPDPEPTQERSRSQLSRNGVMFLLRNLVWLKFFATKIVVYIQYNVFHCHERCIEASTCIFILTNCILQNHLKIKTFGLVQFMIDCQYIKQ